MENKKNPVEGGNLQTGHISAFANHKSFCNRVIALIAGTCICGLIPVNLACWIVQSAKGII